MIMAAKNYNCLYLNLRMTHNWRTIITFMALLPLFYLDKGEFFVVPLMNYFENSSSIYSKLSLLPYAVLLQF